MTCLVKYPRKVLLLLISSVCLVLQSASYAQSTLSLNIDNDWLIGADDDYTSGFAIRFGQTLTDDAYLTTILPHRLLHHSDDGTATWSIEVGQKMWTPTILLAPTTLQGERPYAGLLYLEPSITEIYDNVAHSYSFLFGTTGDRSYAENTQRYVHKVFGSVESKGWDTQIDDQWVFNLGYQGSYKLYYSDKTVVGNQHEITNISRILAGNYRSEIATGVMWRWGTNLSDSFSATSISHAMPFNAGVLRAHTSGLFVFSGFEARLRFNDITLDGDRPEGLPSVSLQPMQATAVIGVANYYHSWGGSFSLAIKTSDYKESEERAVANASMTIFYRF